MQIPALTRWGLKVSGLSALVSASEKRLEERAAVGINRVNSQRNKPKARHTVLYNECKEQVSAFLLLCFAVGCWSWFGELGIEPRAWCMLGRYSTTELCPQPLAISF